MNEWTTNREEVQSIILNHFNALFATSNPSQEDITLALSGMETTINDEMQNWLDADFTAEEIRDALFSMAPWKAPGPDGFHAGFFQKNWELVGDQITHTCLQILNGRISIGEINTTYIILIPKVKRPRNITEYRPISLCNVIAKIVAKSMAIRMKQILANIIDGEQSAFVPGRLISDNIMVAFETLHTIRRRDRGRKGLMAIKLDMNKAYDRVEWEFLWEVMKRLGFSMKWIYKVKDYLTTTCFSILLNGIPSEKFRPTRGLRQGCPLSPYLFLLCSQGLSCMLRRQAENGILKGVKCARNAPEITHLFFADDTLLFGQTDLVTCNVLRDVLQRYEDASGQIINLQKSCITFSPNTNNVEKDLVFQTLHMNRNESYDVYLGLPAFTGRNKKRIFDGIREKVWQKLQLWKSKLFSIGGREVLIKAVAQAIPSYTMSIFRLPVMLCNRLKSMIAEFWWGSKEDEKRIHWRNWSLLCRPKMQGGMGFRDFISFNQSLLAKQAWRLLSNPFSLVSQVYKQRYFPNCSFIEAKLGNNPSYVWRSILWGREILAKGIRWRIGSGANVRAFKDPWLLRPLHFKPITSPSQEVSDMKVSEIINEGGIWNRNLIEEIFWEEDKLEVYRIPIGPHMMEDKLIWHYDSKGVYTVKSGYQLATGMYESCSNGLRCGFRDGLRLLWNSRIPSKIKIHIWRLLFDAVPVKVNLRKRKVEVEVICPICHKHPESIIHSIWNCKAAQKIWNMSVIWDTVHGFSTGGVGDLFQWIVDHGNSMSLEWFALICWSLWIERNLVVFQNKKYDWEEVLDHATRMKDNYKVCLKVASVSRPCENAHQNWRPPPPGMIKINVDAAVIQSTNGFSVGIVGRDEWGILTFAEGRICDGNFSSHLAELCAVREGLRMALESGLSRIIVETDALLVVKEIHENSEYNPLASIVKQITGLCSMFEEASVQHCRREANQVADELARYSFRLREQVMFPCAIPRCISSVACKDLNSL